MGIDQPGQDKLAPASMTISSGVSGRTEPAASPIWTILFPSTTTSVLVTGCRPDPSISVPFLISSRGEEFVITAPPYTIDIEVRA
jgi:hypothetical protein